MAILLNNDYRINKIDCRNFIVEKRKINKKTNQEYWEHVGGYYPNVYELIELLAKIQEKYRSIEIVGEQ